MKEEAPREKCLFFCALSGNKDSDFLLFLSVSLTDCNSFPSSGVFLAIE